MGNYIRDVTTYIVSISDNIVGELEITRFRRALDIVTSHYKSLQTCFFSEPTTGELIQGLLTAASGCFKHIHTSEEVFLKRELKTLKNTVWNQKHGRTFSVTLVTRAPELHPFMLGYHHIIMHGFSWRLFLRDLNFAYRMIPLEPMTKQYVDFTSEIKVNFEFGKLHL